MKNSSSHIESSTGKFFHLMRYLVISKFYNFLILVSIIFSSSSIIFHSSSISRKIVRTRILSPITLFNHKTWKTRCTYEDVPICNPYYQSWVLIYCPSFSWGKFLCIVVASEISNLPLQNFFRRDVDLLVISSYFMIYPSCPSIVVQLIVSVIHNLPQLEP